MKVKFQFVPEDILIQLDRGELVVELTAEELEAYADIEEKYFKMQYLLKQKAKTEGGNKYFSDGRD